jgi:protein-arginine kinase activator protein McsA
MKCLNCGNDYYPHISETFYADGKKYRQYICDTCGEPHYFEIKRKGHWNHVKVLNNIAILITILFELGITQTILTHQELFFIT